MTWTELGGSPKESINESSGSSAERRFVVPMNQRITLAQSLVGTGHPHFPFARLVAIDLQPYDEGLGSLGDIPHPEISGADYGDQPCLLVAKYGPDYTQKTWPTDFPQPGFRIGTELRYQITGNAQFLLIPTSACKWEDDQGTVPEDTNTAVIINQSSFRLQWDFIDDPPITRFEELQGTVNQTTFLGSPSETLLFETYDVSESFRASPLLPHTNRVSVQFSRRSIKDDAGTIYGWNHDYREEPAGWHRLLKSDDEPRYPLKEFSGIFL